MNKFLRTSLALSIVIFVFSSCSNRISLVKRHYNKGYYFAKTPAVSKPQAQKVEPTKPVVIASVPTVTVNSGAQSEAITANVSSSQKNGSSPAIKSTDKSTKPFLNLVSKPSTENNQLFFAQSKRPFVFANAGKEVSNVQNEGRSLFWIVVVVLIVLWALGLISGSFGLFVIFNLLLVIALVLLLLWLLRIV